MKPRMSGIADDARGLDDTGKCVQRLHVALETGLLPRCEIEVVHAELAGLGEQRVVDIGDVANALDRVAHVDQASLQHVVDDERRGMTEMRRVVRRDATGVHRHLFVGFEWYDGPPSRVVETHAQPNVLGSWRIPVSLGATRVL